MVSCHIVIVANTAWSVFNFRHGLLCGLVANGHRVTVVAPYDDFFDKLEKIGCNVVELTLASKGVNPLEDAKLLVVLYQVYRKIRPDCIIHYTIKPNIYGSIAAKLAKVPSLAVTTGLGYTFINNSVVAKIAKKLYKLAFRFPREVWFLNEDDRQVFLVNNLVSDSRAVLLHGEGIDVSFFSPMPSVRENCSVCFLLIARMLWDKGIGEYVEAARLIKGKYPDVRFQLLGACDAKNPSIIDREQVMSWEREGIIEYLGTTDDVRSAIANADCVVLPSYREGIPRTMLEAAAMAKPLIVSDAPGCKDVVIHERTGWICKTKDPCSLAMCCENLILMPKDMRDEMGMAGRKFIEDVFDEQLVVKKYFDFLSRCNIGVKI